MIDMAETAKVVAHLFKTMGAPGIISFSGGAPSSDLLPYDAVREINDKLMRKETGGRRLLQYGDPQGEIELRRAISKYLLEPKGVHADPEKELIVVNGGMESMSMVCELFIDPGDVILVESPTFVQTLETFEMFQAKCIGVKCDDNGMDMNDLEAKIKEYQPKVIYVIPTFQNPSGRTTSLERRKRIAELAGIYDIVVLEDDPYRDLRFDGEHLTPIKSFDKSGNVIMCSSLSKVFAPGTRLGYIYAQEEILSHLYDVKTATNSQTNTTLQLLCAEFFEGGYFEQHLTRCIDTYRVRRDAMAEAIKEHFPEGTHYVVPEGGLFFWAELPGNINTTKLQEYATEYKVAFLPGEKFFVGGDETGKRCMRLSYGNVYTEDIREGISRLGKLIAEYSE